jgi:hypothetical protein
VYLFGSIWWYLDAPKQHEIKYFLVVSDYFSYKKGPIDLVRGLILSLDTGIYISPNWGLLSTFTGPFGGAQTPHSIKTYFLVVLDNFFAKNGPNDMVRGLSLSLDIGTYILPTCRPLCTILAPFGGAQIPQKSIKEIFSGYFGVFFLQEWA